MKTLTKNQKLHITRIGQCLTLEKIAKKVFLSTSFVSLMEKGTRQVPVFVESVIKIDDGTKWYETIVASLSGDVVSEDDSNSALEILNNVLKIR